MQRFTTTMIIKVLPLIFLFSLTQSIAQAHTTISSTYPEYKKTLEVMPERISIEFADNLMSVGDKVINTIKLVDSHSKSLRVQKSVTDGHVLSVKVPKKNYEGGTYTVYYRAVSKDGHAVSGSYEFYVKFKSKSKANIKEENLDFLNRHQDHILFSTGTLIVLLVFSIRKFLRKRDDDENV